MTHDIGPIEVISRALVLHISAELETCRAKFKEYETPRLAGLGCSARADCRFPATCTRSLSEQHQSPIESQPAPPGTRALGGDRPLQRPSSVAQGLVLVRNPRCT